jgi:hypothetical protein
MQARNEKYRKIEYPKRRNKRKITLANGQKYLEKKMNTPCNNVYDVHVGQKPATPHTPTVSCKLDQISFILMN